MSVLQLGSGGRRTHADAYVWIYLKVFHYLQNCSDSVFLSCLSSVSLLAPTKGLTGLKRRLVCERDMILQGNALQKVVHCHHQLFQIRIQFRVLVTIFCVSFCFYFHLTKLYQLRRSNMVSDKIHTILAVNQYIDHHFLTLISLTIMRVIKCRLCKLN